MPGKLEEWNCNVIDKNLNIYYLNKPQQWSMEISMDVNVWTSLNILSICVCAGNHVVSLFMSVWKCRWILNCIWELLNMEYFYKEALLPWNDIAAATVCSIDTSNQHSCRSVQENRHLSSNTTLIPKCPKEAQVLDHEKRKQD